MKLLAYLFTEVAMLGFSLFKKKEKLAVTKPEAPKPAPKEFYPELPELPELKEPEPLPLKPLNTERIRAAIEKKDIAERPRPAMPEEMFEKRFFPEPELPAEKGFEEESAFEAKEPKATHAFAIGKPVFIEGGDFRKVISGLNSLTRKPAKLKQLENEEEKKFEELHNNLEDIQRKMILMDRTIFGGG